MNDRFYTNELSEIRSFCIRSDKEDIYKYIYSLQQENQELKDRIDKAVEITHKILMNNADNRMICSEEEIDYFDWLDREMLKQENLLKGDKEC